MSVLYDNNNQVIPGTREITPIIAAQVLWFDTHEPPAIQPGSFYEALITAVFKADASNRGRLASVFPGVVAAVRLYRDSDEGHVVLEKIARGEDVV